MTDWVLVPCLETLFAEFDEIAPSRDHASDGRKGDTAHEKETSDHNPDETGKVPQHDADSINEVHAIDVDADLRASFTMEDVIQFLLAECRKSSGTDRGRLKYFIYNRRMWQAVNGWRQETYTGSNPHDKHAHFSAEYATEYESDTHTWGLIERFGMTPDDVRKIIREELTTFFNRTTNADGTPQSRIGADAFDQGIPDPEGDTRAKAYNVIKQIGVRAKSADEKLDEVLAETGQILAALNPPA